MISSIRNLNPPAGEVIFINDASPDETATILAGLPRHFGSCRIRVLDQMENSGQCAAINRAVEESNSSLFMIANDDDYLVPDATGRMLGILESNPEAHLAGGSSYWITDDREITGALKMIDEKPAGQVYFFTLEQIREFRSMNDFNITHTGSVFTREIWNSVGGYFSYKKNRVVPFSDRDFQLRCLSLAPAVATDHIVALWRSNSSVDAGVNS